MRLQACVRLQAMRAASGFRESIFRRRLATGDNADLLGWARFKRPLDTEEATWGACAVRMVTAARETVLPLLGTAAGRHVLTRGKGGDLTLELDRRAEEAAVRALDAWAPAPYLLISEELGFAGQENARWRVVVDPVDGSLNAKRGLSPCSSVVALADGPTVGDVRLGCVIDFATAELFLAVRGAGFAFTTPRDIPQSDRVEVVLLEAGRPDWHPFQYGDLADFSPGDDRTGVRVRQMGSLALGLCHIAAGSADVLVTPVPARAVDIAAGIRMVWEAGGGVAGLDGLSLDARPLDLQRRAAFVAWRAGIEGRAVEATARRVFGNRA